MLSGNAIANPAANGNIDVSINQNVTPEVVKEEDANTFREHMSYRKKMLAMMNKNPSNNNVQSRQ